jgi:hypothetical protein
MGLVGLYMVRNPEKHIPSTFLQRAAQHFIDPVSKPTAKNNIIVGYLPYLTAVGIFWGSYMLLVNIMPEKLLEILPVTKSHFNKAFSYLEDHINKIRDTLKKQIFGLSEQQKELSAKQDFTYHEIVCVREDIRDLSTNLSHVREIVDTCQESLVEAEKRQSYIALGVRLLARGVSSILPRQDTVLVQELHNFYNAYQPQQPTSQSISSAASTEVRANIALSSHQISDLTSGIKEGLVDVGTPKKRPSPENEHPVEPGQSRWASIVS